MPGEDALKVKRVLEILENRSQLFWSLAGSVCVGLLGLVDHLTGYEISFSLFYLAPITLVTWFGSRRLGGGLSILSALAWLAAEITAGQRYSHPIIYLWNSAIRFGFFIIVTHLVSEVQKLHETERTLARIDPVSGAWNARYFREMVERELAAARRYPRPFTIVYLDIDNFKAVNNTWGHETGDRMLRFIAAELNSQLRSTDIAARLGGDEFALFLPAAGEDEARVVVSKLHADLTRLLKQGDWPVTFSAGALSCIDAPDSLQEIMKMADELMYAVKNSTKNNVRFAVYFRRDDP